MSVFNIIEKDGTQVWRKNGMLHRDNDLPAIIHPDGSMEWWYEDELHRVGKPAYIDADGTMMWYEKDELIATYVAKSVNSQLRCATKPIAS
jgi:hypothetical protein